MSHVGPKRIGDIGSEIEAVCYRVIPNGGPDCGHADAWESSTMTLTSVRRSLEP